MDGQNGTTDALISSRGSPSGDIFLLSLRVKENALMGQMIKYSTKPRKSNSAYMIGLLLKRGLEEMGVTYFVVNLVWVVFLHFTSAKSNSQNPAVHNLSSHW